MDYKNLYAGLEPSDRVRTTVELPTKTKSAINNYDSKPGVLQTTFSLLFTKLTDELSKSNIPAGEHDKYRHAVANAVISFPAEYYPVTAAAKPTTANRGKRSTVAKSATGSVSDSTAQAAG